MNEVRDTPITNIHGGTNSFTQLIDTYRLMKTCGTPSKRRDQYLCENCETNETLYTHYPR